MSDAPVTASFPALGTVAIVAVVDPAALAAAREQLAFRLDAVDIACSRFRSDSELVLANAQSGSPVIVSELLARFVRFALDAARDSGGLVDPTMGAQLRAAGYDRTFALVRERDGWSIGRPVERYATWEDVELDDEGRTLLVPFGVELDFGATAKALAADDAANAIAASAGTGVLVSLGGDLAVAGPAPRGGWAVRIADDHAAPLDSGGPIVTVSSGGLATSGTAVRRWRTDAGNAHHILDPRTGRPAVTPWRTVSVAAATCADANVASTTAIVLGEGATGWLAERGLPARCVRDDGSVTTVGGWPGEARAA
ncbi:MAG TPA: FAD:protein FMN transferase [Gaiellaceae bacterium]|nr:FAD:protein FMN transferase [Gaiellaceae bacterium]